MRRRSFGGDAGQSGRARGGRLPDRSTRATRAWADSASLRSAGRSGSTGHHESQRGVMLWPAAAVGSAQTLRGVGETTIDGCFCRPAGALFMRKRRCSTAVPGQNAGFRAERPADCEPSAV